VPEILEVEMYRRLAEDAALDRPIAAVIADDRWYLKGALQASELVAALLGRTLVRARRRGKLLLLDTSGEGPVLGLRFGMTGRLSVDGASSVDRLLYAPVAPGPHHDRFGLGFEDGGDLRVSDPRRLGGVELDADEDRLGPDALSVTVGELSRALGERSGARRQGRATLKSRLLDQSRLAGVGNLLADEMLWRAGLAPQRLASSLDGGEVRRLHRRLAETLVELGGRGGSHTGDLMGQRRPGGVCPRDGTALRRDQVGGRTSWWCPLHQR
jgi:formamidopyrimidine-DNA glycosylase